MNISIIGTGRVAFHLAKVFFSRGHNLVQIIGRDSEAAMNLAKEVNAQGIVLYDAPIMESELIVVAIADDAIGKLKKAYFLPHVPIVHTSGSVAMEALSAFEHHGVFYPLQTFSKDREVDFSNVPILIEANNKRLFSQLVTLGESISSCVEKARSDERKQLHLAAVFASNFSNQMFALAKDILDQKNLSFEWLKPLILETAQKALEFEPDEVQTGPAVRNDQRIISLHLEMLKENPRLQELYQLLTQMISYKQHSKYEEL